MWFGNLPTFTELQGFHYYQEKYKVRQYSFSLTQKLHPENLNYQKNGFYILRTGFTMGYKTGQKIFIRQYLRDSAICMSAKLQGFDYYLGKIQSTAV